MSSSLLRTVDQGGNVVQACKRLGDLDLNYAKIRALGIIMPMEKMVKR